MKRYYSVSDYCRDTYGEKLYKLSLSTGFTCPNRDGTTGTGGCAFCTGAGEFSADAALDAFAQIEQAKARVADKFRGDGYIAYFGSGTNTYGDLGQMERLFRDAAAHPQIRVLSVATRPDCLPDEVLTLLASLRAVKPLWVELGLQTADDRVADSFGRGYGLDAYERAVSSLRQVGAHIITHVVFGLPGESRGGMLDTVRYVSDRTDGVKLHSLYVCRGTALEREWRAGRFDCLERDAYIELLGDALELLKPQTVVHRLTGDGDKRTLLAPMWTADKKAVLAAIERRFRERDVVQGRCYG